MLSSYVPGRGVVTCIPNVCPAPPGPDGPQGPIVPQVQPVPQV